MGHCRASKAWGPSRRSPQIEPRAARANRPPAHQSQPPANKSTDKLGISGSRIRGTHSGAAAKPTAKTTVKTPVPPQAQRLPDPLPLACWAAKAINRPAAGVAGIQ